MLKKISLHKIAFLLITILVAVIPFSALLLTWKRYLFGLSGLNFLIISFWKEYILIFLFIIIGIKFFKEKKLNINFLKIDKIIFSFFIILFFYFLFFNMPLSQKMLGLRYDIEFLLLYFAVRLLNFNLKELRIIIYIFISSSFIAIIFGLLQISFLPPEFMKIFGYSSNLDEYVKTGFLPTYSSLDPSLPNTYRIQSAFPGSIQFSSYIVFVIAISSALIFSIKNNKRYCYLLLTILSLFALYATHTRSAWIASGISLLILFTLIIKNKKVLLISALGFLLALFLSLFILVNNHDIQTVLLHGEFREGQLFGSTQAHFDSLLDSSELFIKNPIGNGLGYAGPASKISNNVIVTENGYLQIGLELGFLGLIIFLLIILGFLATLKDIFHNNKDIFQKYLSVGLLCALLGIAINNIFLHTFADTATIYPLFIFIGILISLNQKELS